MATAEPSAPSASPDQAVSVRRHRYRRSRKMIRPGLQIKVGVIFAFVLISTLAFFAARLHLVVASHGGLHGEQAQADFGQVLRSELLVALALGIALTLAVAVAVTFRLAGPVYRMSQFLKAVRAGTQTEPCRLRKGDAFDDLCTLVNEATEAQRLQNEKTADSHCETAASSDHDTGLERHVPERQADAVEVAT